MRRERPAVRLSCLLLLLLGVPPSALVLPPLDVPDGDHDLTPIVSGALGSGALGSRSGAGGASSRLRALPPPYERHSCSAAPPTNWITDEGLIAWSAAAARVYNPTLFPLGSEYLVVARSAGAPHGECRDPRLALWAVGTHARAITQRSRVLPFVPTLNVSRLWAAVHGGGPAGSSTPNGRRVGSSATVAALRDGACLRKKRSYPECCQHAKLFEDPRLFGREDGSVRACCPRPTLHAA